MPRHTSEEEVVVYDCNETGIHLIDKHNLDDPVRQQQLGNEVGQGVKKNDGFRINEEYIGFSQQRGKCPGVAS